jgi:hypothetical protein
LCSKTFHAYGSLNLNSSIWCGLIHMHRTIETHTVRSEKILLRPLN